MNEIDHEIDQLIQETRERLVNASRDQDLDELVDAVGSLVEAVVKIRNNPTLP